MITIFFDSVVAIFSVMAHQLQGTSRERRSLIIVMLNPEFMTCAALLHYANYLTQALNRNSAVLVKSKAIF